MPVPTLEQRLAARQRPAGAALLCNRWEELLFLHWAWDAQALQARLPAGLTVDTYEGRAYVGLVPFLMREVRYSAPALRGPSFNFLELNVRTYVHDDAGNPGVWFFSLECNLLPAVLSARALFGLNYRHRRMAAQRSADGRLDYRCLPLWSALPRSARYRYRAQGQASPAEPGSLEFFLVERYRLFSLRGRRLQSGLVHHAPYSVGQAELLQYSELPLAWNKLALPGRPPDHVLHAQPVDVEIFPLLPL